MSSKAHHIIVDNIHRIINLRHVTDVVRKDNILTFKYNIKRDDGMFGFLFGNSQYSMTITCNNAEEAASQIEQIKKLM